MNAQRRKQIQAILETVKDLEVRMQSLIEAIEEVQSQEQDYFDNMPQSFQDGDKGTNVQAAIDAMDNAKSTIESCDLSDVASSLEGAMA